MATAKWVRLPCKCGDKVYIVNRKLNRVFEHTVVGFLVGPESPRRNFILTSYVNKYHCETKMRWGFNLIGSVVFFNLSDAKNCLVSTERKADCEQSNNENALIAECARLKSEVDTLRASLYFASDDDVDCYCE